MPELFRYSNNFEPILLEGMTATLFGTELPPEGKNVRCIAVGALPEYLNDFGALTANTWLEEQEDTDLEMNPMEMSQLRMRVVDDMQVRLRNPAAVQQWRTMNTNFYLPQFPLESGSFLQEFLFKASEFFIWEDVTPRFSLRSAIATTASRVLFSGWRFKMEAIPDRGKIQIWINEWPSGRVK